MSARSGRSLTSKPTVVVTAGQVGQVSLGSNWYCFLNGLGADVVIDYIEQNIRYPGHSTVDVVFDNQGFPDVR